MPGPKTYQAAAGRMKRSPSRNASNGLTPIAQKMIHTTTPTVGAAMTIMGARRLQGERTGGVGDHFSPSTRPGLARRAHDAASDDYAVRDLPHPPGLLAGRDA